MILHISPSRATAADPPARCTDSAGALRALPAGPATRLRPATRPGPSIRPGPLIPGHPTARVVDLGVAALAFVVLAPVMAVIAAVVACTSRGPALFKQVRLGRYGHPFVMYKFRTMAVDNDDQLHRDYVRRLLQEPATSACGPEGLYKLVDDPRITPVGRWLRRSSLDELPQLFNVLRGEMSLVGPRPVLPWEAALFNPRHQKRFLVRPGMTGLWQTSGRNQLTMTQALDLDVRYVEEQCLRLDLAILLRTIPVMLGRKGVR